MKSKNIVFCALAASLFVSGNSSAVPIVADYGININGDNVLLSDGIAFQSGVDVSGIDGDGLGLISIAINTAGTYAIDAFFDYEFDDFSNSFFNESGSANGAAGVGQSWEIDEPGFVSGDIFDNWLNNDLDDMNAVPVGLEDDVSVALGWDFMLGANEVAELVFSVSSIAPMSGFYLAHIDEDADDAVFFSSTLNIRQLPPNPNTIPEPTTMGMLLLGLSGLFAKRKSATS